MMARLRNVGIWLRERLSLDPDTRRGSVRGIEIAAWVLFVLIPVLIFSSAPSTYNFLAMALAAAMALLAVALVWLLLRLIARSSARLHWALLLLAMVLLPFLWLGPTLYVLSALVVLSLALAGGGIASLRRRGAYWQNLVSVVLGAGSLLTVAVALVLDGWPTEEKIVWQPMQTSELALDDPAAPGAFAVERFTYGPGSDPHRAEFGANVRFVTETVDGSKLVDGWQGAAGWARSAFWNADVESLPVRGQVWMPQGSGPFPLVLIVHGNHAMEDFSDGGYAYLGELFASRGAVAVSVDENFLNLTASSFLSLFDGGLEEENDARGWLLLEHLRQFRDWSADATHDLHGQIDLDRVVLIGHSRGGEAVTEAAVFNRLSHYPDDATVTFDYNFGLRGVIAVAPVDNQYDPRDFATVMEDVSYLVIHGSHDSDVNSYAGFAAYSRLQFESCASCFKAGFYLIGANHGQFNTSWGRYDVPPPFDRFLNSAPLLDGATQRRVASVLFSAFLEATVHDRDAYRQLVAAPERQAALFGDGVRFLSHYRGAQDLILADFGEDAEVSTGSIEGARISGAGLSLWREADLGLKWRTADNAMVQLGWQETGATYEISGFAAPIVPETLSLSLGMSSDAPGDVEDYEPPDELDFHIELEDGAGQVASLPLSTRRVLLPQVEPVMYKLPGLDADASSEVVMQRYRFALDEFVAVNPQLDPATLRTVSLRFDLSPMGSLWLDDVALSAASF